MKNYLLVSLALLLCFSCSVPASQKGVTDQVLIKGSKPIDVVAARVAPYAHNVMYMPIINIQTEKGKALFDSYIEQGSVPMAYEVCWDHNDDGAFADAAFESDDPGKVYRQYLDAGASMIQIDRPELLIAYLKKTGHHRLK